MSRSLKDHVIEAQRAQLIPHFYDMQEIALRKGAMNYTISGAGPSMFGFAINTIIAEEASSAIQTHLRANNIASRVYISQVNKTGSHKM